MQLEDINLQLFNTKAKLFNNINELEKLKCYEAKYNNIDISELHKHIRNLENQLELCQNNNSLPEMHKDPPKFCTICWNEIDKNNERVKKIIIEGGRNQNNIAPVHIFLSTDEEIEDKMKRESLIKDQPEIIEGITNQLRGYTDDEESFGMEKSGLTHESSDEDILGEIPVICVQSK